MEQTDLSLKRGKKLKIFHGTFVSVFLSLPSSLFLIILILTIHNYYFHKRVSRILSTVGGGSCVAVGTCMAGVCVAGGHAWQGAYMAGDVHAWWGGGMHGRRLAWQRCVNGRYGKHPTGMHSSLKIRKF